MNEPKEKARFNFVSSQNEDTTTLSHLGASKFCDVAQFSVLDRTRFVRSQSEQLNIEKMLGNVGIKRPNYKTVRKLK